MKISTNLNVPLAFVKKSAKKLNTHTTNTHKAQKMVMVVYLYMCVFGYCQWSEFIAKMLVDMIFWYV